MDHNKPFDYVAELAALSEWNFKRQARIEEIEAELAEARKDGERLDWLHERMAHVTEWTKGRFVVETRRYGGSRWMTKPIYKTPRAAIDAARAADGGKG